MVTVTSYINYGVISILHAGTSYKGVIYIHMDCYIHMGCYS